MFETNREITAAIRQLDESTDSKDTAAIRLKLDECNELLLAKAGQITRLEAALEDYSRITF